MDDLGMVQDVAEDPYKLARVRHKAERTAKILSAKIKKRTHRQ